MKKTLALISALLLILCTFASCGKKTANIVENTTVAQTDENGETTEAPTINVEEITAEEMTKEDIVALYNMSVNAVKPEAKQITREYQKVSCPEDLVQLPSAIESIGKSAMKTFVKGSDEPVVWTSKEDFKVGFPVGGEDYSSKLTPDMVETATITDNGDTYQIELKLYNDKITSPAKGNGYAGVFNTVSASTFNDISIPGVTFNSVNINGINGSISATIDKETSKVTQITFRNTDIMKLNVKVGFSTLDCSIGLKNESKFTIKY